jgi:hypothetical protein
MDDLFGQIDLYCERLGPGLWAEPLNAVSNVAFLIAGFWGLAAIRRAKAGGFATLLGWWVVAIGLGSLAFHLFANRLTALADVIPIGIFTLLYTLFALRVLMRLSWANSIAGFVLFYAAAIGLSALVPDWLAVATNGSTGYLVPFLSLFVFGAILLATGNPAGTYILGGALVFTLSVAFRSVDQYACPALPIGTHFLWHILNGLLLGLLLAAAAKYGGQGRMPPA